LKIEGASLASRGGDGSIMDVTGENHASTAQRARRGGGGDASDVGADERLELVGRSLLRPTGSGGVPARTAAFETVIAALGALIARHRETNAEVLRFPPVMSRHQVEKSGYLHSFPNLLGCVCGLHGGEAEIQAAVGRPGSGKDWTESLKATNLVLTPAACYPVYPLAAARGAVPATGLSFDVESYCFRREATIAADRLEAFRMREFVCIGLPEKVAAFREAWLERAGRLSDRLGLPHRIETASDPFFGRAARIIAANQVEQLLKFELLIPLRSPERPTACMSFNYHRDHFAAIWGLRGEYGTEVHTACVAFGMERLVLALFAIHGLNVAQWPASVREELAL
jgi:seryl-tRNA synthetase